MCDFRGRCSYQRVPCNCRSGIDRHRSIARRRNFPARIRTHHCCTLAVVRSMLNSSRHTPATHHRSNRCHPRRKNCPPHNWIHRRCNCLSRNSDVARRIQGNRRRRQRRYHRRRRRHLGRNSYPRDNSNHCTDTSHHRKQDFVHHRRCSRCRRRSTNCSRGILHQRRKPTRPGTMYCRTSNYRLGNEVIAPSRPRSCCRIDWGRRLHKLRTRRLGKSCPHRMKHFRRPRHRSCCPCHRILPAARDTRSRCLRHHLYRRVPLRNFRRRSEIARRRVHMRHRHR